MDSCFVYAEHEVKSASSGVYQAFCLTLTISVKRFSPWRRFLRLRRGAQADLHPCYLHERVVDPIREALSCDGERKIAETAGKLCSLPMLPTGLRVKFIRLYRHVLG